MVHNSPISFPVFETFLLNGALASNRAAVDGHRVSCLSTQLNGHKFSSTEPLAPLQLGDTLVRTWECERRCTFFRPKVRRWDHTEEIHRLPNGYLVRDTFEAADDRLVVSHTYHIGPSADGGIDLESGKPLPINPSGMLAPFWGMLQGFATNGLFVPES